MLDEIEKAHPDVFNLLLQVLDDGRLTDNKGRTVNFKNVIIIMTSNMGSDIIRERMEQYNNKLSEAQNEQLQQDVMSLLRKSFRPEFLNRVDEIVLFKPLTEEQIKEIVKMQVKGVSKLVEKNGITLSVTDKAISWLAEQGYDPQLGARPVKRLIQKEIVNNLSKELIAGHLPMDSHVVVDYKEGKIVFENEKE